MAVAEAATSTPSRMVDVADVLVVEDRASLRAMLVRTLGEAGYATLDAGSVAEAQKLLRRARVSVVLTDLRLPSGTGMDVLRCAREIDPNMPVVMMTAFGTVQDAVAAMKDGAFDFLSKPVDTDHLLLLIDRAVTQRRLLREHLILKEEYAARYGFPEIIGEHEALRAVSLELQRAAGTEATVLLLGESGTGKELFARALHQLSGRASGPFVPINCAAIPAELLENELFGHEKGAYTGATTQKVGRLELAHEGTVLLDEMGELPLPLQSKLLRVLQEREFERVGGTRTLSVDVRIVAATNRDLKKSVAAGEFREDLYYRLSVYPISIPALRERRSDIALLAEHYVAKFCAELGRAPIAVAPDSAAAMEAYAWPGNVRELANCIERAVILCDGGELHPAHLGLGALADENIPSGLDLSGTLAEVSRRAAASAEKEKIRLALEETNQDRPQAAEMLQVSGKTLLNKMREYGLVKKAES